MTLHEALYVKVILLPIIVAYTLAYVNLIPFHGNEIVVQKPF